MRVDVADLFPTALGIYKWDHEKHMELKKLTQELIKTRQRMNNPMTEDIGHYYNVSEESLLELSVRLNGIMMSPVIKSLTR